MSLIKQIYELRQYQKDKSFWATYIDFESLRIANNDSLPDGIEIPDESVYKQLMIFYRGQGEYQKTQMIMLQEEMSDDTITGNLNERLRMLSNQRPDKLMSTALKQYVVLTGQGFSKEITLTFMERSYANNDYDLEVIIDE